jgi:hypothetical protein
VNHDHISGLVHGDDLVGKLLIHAVEVGPLQPLLSPVGRLMLLIVEEGVEFGFSESPPPSLIFQADSVPGFVDAVSKPYRYGLYGLAVR